MIIVHDAEPFVAGTKRKPRRMLLASVILLFATAIAGAGVGIYYALIEPQSAIAVGPGKNYVRIDFSHLPGQKDKALSLAVDMTVADPAKLKPLDAEDAIAANNKIPLANVDNPSALAMVVPLGDGSNFLRSLDCMTAAVYYEAAQEPTDGQRAVAQVVLNRVRNIAYPHTVCGVVFQGSERRTGCQFSFTCDGSLSRQPSIEGWKRARAVASAALSGMVYAPVGLSTHYHADYVVPYWASSLLKISTIGRHIFYRWPGAWGRPAAFTSAYAINEPLVFGKGGLAENAAVPLEGVNALNPAALSGDLAIDRPILRSDTRSIAGVSGEKPAGDKAAGENGQRNLSATNAGPPAPPPPLRSMTGGVIMPGRQTLPEKPSAPSPAVQKDGKVPVSKAAQ